MASKANGKTKKKTTGRSTAGKRLVIVESPAKARTLGRYLGRGYDVQASMGHVRDLPKSVMGVDVDHDFEPKYLIPRDKSTRVKELKKMVQGARELILATDPDREGEAIAWHLIEATEPSSDVPVKRVVFHEVTPNAVREAMEHPRELNTRLVDAQQARRILDRLVGYSISPLLWKKVKSGLSAGRVQSAALRIVVQREREIQEFVSTEYWTLDADLAKQSGNGRTPASFQARLNRIEGAKAELPNGDVVERIIKRLDGAAWEVASVRVREARRRPAAPFTTSTLQQEASRKLRSNVRRTMQIAQELYEGVDLGPEGATGLITYMRTDSTNVASVAQERAREAIRAHFSADLLPEKPPTYARRSKGAQEAHEAIRPTDPMRHPDQVKRHLSNAQYRLYRLIWQRFMASQMREAIFDATTVDVDAILSDGTRPYQFRATGSVIKFQGFLAVYREGRDDDEEDEIDRSALPELAQGEPLDLNRLLPEQHWTQPPPRYTEASLVKALEEYGIGRPSTYAPTIQNIVSRNYVTVDERKLVPTELGFVINDILVEHFPTIVDLEFTSRLEEELDEIATGEREWVPMLTEFWKPFTARLSEAEQTMERVKIRDEPTGEMCPECGKPLVFKLGKFGKFVGCSGFPECRFTQPFLEKIDITCPQCGQGQLVERRTKRGRIFYGCERYPECDFAAWSKPTGEKCPECGGVMVVANRNETLQKCQDCNHRMAIPQAEPVST
jgi:DNA topoisomerase-1